MINNDNLTNEQCRVIIAQDVIKQLKLRRFTALRGSHYMKAECKNIEQLTNDNILSEITDCQVCALGSMLLSHIQTFNHFNLQRLVVKNSNGDRRLIAGSNDCAAVLSQYFTHEQLNVIESAFEGWFGNTYYLSKYPNSNDRLMAIMQNIVYNQGKFVYSESE